MGNTASQGAQGTKQNMPPQKKQIEKFDVQTDYQKMLDSNIRQYTRTEPNLLPVIPGQHIAIGGNKDNDQNFGVFKTIYGETVKVQSDNYQGSRNVIPNAEGHKQLASPLTRIFDFIYASNIPPGVEEGQNLCETYNSLNCNVNEYIRDQYLYGNQRGKDTRCGFIYNPSNTDGQPVFRGHYGEWLKDINGEDTIGLFQTAYTHDNLLNNPNTEQYWRLNNCNSFNYINNNCNIGAQNAFRKYKCQIQAPRCSNISPTNSPGCVWREDLFRSVPYDLIDPSDNNPVYGLGTKQYTGRNTDLECPIPPVEFIDRSAGDSCRDSNGSLLNGSYLNKRCVQSILNKQGCTDQGTLLYALGQCNDRNVSYGICNIPAASNYPDLLNLFNNNITVSNASNIISLIRSNADKTESNSSNYSARDLCLSNGFFATFDFCTEYGPNTTSYELRCLQREFRYQGGQISAYMYPTLSNRSFYDSKPNWPAVQSYIGSLCNDTTSSNIDTQAKAFYNFYGISTQQYMRQYIPKIPGVEVFWFTIISDSYSDKSINDFLGRRVQPDLTLNMSGVQTTNIQFISFFNLRPYSNDTQVKFTFNNTDGIQVIKDQNIKTTTNADQGKIYAAWTDSAARNNQITSPCWALTTRSNNPNYFTVAWYNKQTSPIFTQSLFQTCDANPKTVNSTGAPQMTMTQELDAPILSFEVLPNPTANQIAYYSYSKIIDYTFGDARLRDIFLLEDMGGTNSKTFNNTEEHFGFSNRFFGDGTTVSRSNSDMTYIYGVLNVNNGGYIRSRPTIHKNSWRTISMLFKTKDISLTSMVTNNIDKAYIFQYNSLSVYIKRDNTGYKFCISLPSGDQTIREDTLTGTTVSINTSYYLIIIRDIASNDGSDIKFRFCIASKDNIISNSLIPFADSSSQNMNYNTDPFSYSQNSSKKYQFHIGGTTTGPVENNMGTTQSLNMTVGWVRFFDYVFSTDDVTRDINNTWKRGWWNMI